jgi:hypothetical protein
MYLSIEFYKYAPDIDCSLLQLFPVDKLVFILAGGFVRLSILAYLPRINRESKAITHLQVPITDLSLQGLS